MSLRQLGFLLALLLLPRVALAQLTFEDDRPRAFSIQERPYRLGHEFELGVGVLPLDALYVGTVLGFSYTYHFSDFWAWEIVSVDYSYNIETSVRADIMDRFGLAPDRLPAEVRLFGATSLVVKPLFGKIAVRNETLLYGETFFTLGVGPHMLVWPAGLGQGSRSDWVPAVNAAVSLRFWINEMFSLRFSVRDYLLFVHAVPQNSLLLMFSTSFNFRQGGS